MKKFKRSLFAAVAVMMMFLTGCGTELYELTAEEENLIIHSAAYFVAKHNIQQKDGVNGYPLPDSFEEESESEDQSTEDGSGSNSEEDKKSEDMTALAELIGHKDTLKITYVGSQVTKTYKEGSAYLVDAKEGKTFYVMKFKLTNITGEDVVVDNASKSPQVKLVCDAVTAKSEVTFLMSDFSTYQGTVKEGEAVETILLFEVSEKVANEITSPKLQIKIGKTTKTIKL